MYGLQAIRVNPPRVAFCQSQPGRNGMAIPQFDPRLATPNMYARMYRELGWQVVPCWRPGEPPDNAAWKRPKLPWKELQTTLVPQPVFDRWYPPRGHKGDFSDRSNMGLITGPCSGNVFI